jgi:hypothetical protein
MANAREVMTVDLPYGELDGLVIKPIEVKTGSVSNFREALAGRGAASGTYTGLYLNGRLWMSDTDAEKRDHYQPAWKIQNEATRRVLINGLGLGMLLKVALACDHVEHVDVVEIDPRVVALVGAHYAKDPRVNLHTADAYEQAKAWPPGTRWDVAWSDIWPDLCTDNLEDMARLRRSYGRRTGWHDCWGRELLLAHRARERRIYGAWR